ncbi:MAG TPA: hypothetical protein VJ960_01820 [Oceanipulchritudo sp.]|nr:hypothetical protein [Oceanipulchritudo sp.]
MNNLIFQYYVPVASSFILGGLILIGMGMLLWPVTSRLKDSLFAVLIYISIAALGMSGNLKHLSPIGLIHAITALSLAILAIKHYKNRISYLFLVPCLFTGVVLLFNLFSEGRGLELMGRWNTVP